MSDNSHDWDRLIEHYSEVEEFGTEPQRAELLDALRAAAALARENAELREWIAIAIAYTGTETPS